MPSTKPENFAGIHAPRMLVIADEAKGIDAPVFTELQGVLSSAVRESRLVMVSTAGPSTGYFYSAFQRPELWRLHRTRSTDSRYARGFAERMLEDCLGPDDPIYRMQVLAEFASDVESQLIPLSAIQAAVGREFEDDEKAGVLLGCDIARFGEDQTVLVVRQGRRVVGLKAWRGADTMASADRIASELNARGAKRAVVDVIGLGAGVMSTASHHMQQEQR